MNVPDAFAELDARTRDFSDALRENACKPSQRFERGGVVERLRVLGAIGNAWSCEIVFLLHIHGPQRFGELKAGLGRVSSRVLTDKLRHLESHGLVAREQTAYALTPDGAFVARHLHPIVHHFNRTASAVRSASPLIP